MPIVKTMALCLTVRLESTLPAGPPAAVTESPLTFTISDLAAEFQITPRTIRFWEDQGLIAPRREGGKRVFSRRDRTRLKLALRGKRLGLSLAEIKDLIGMYDTDRDDRVQLLSCLAVLAKRRTALEQQREDIEAVLGELNAFEGLCRSLVGEGALPAGTADAVRTAGVSREAGTAKAVPDAGPEASPIPSRRFLAQDG